MEDKRFTRRDFMKAVGAGAIAFGLSQWAPVGAAAETLTGKEKEGLTDGQWFYPASTTLLLIPIRKDWTYDDTGPAKRLPLQVNLDSSVPLQARNMTDFQVNGVNLKTAEIPFAGGNTQEDQYMGIAILELNGNKYYETGDMEGQILGGFTGILGEGESPTEIWNIFQAAKNLLTFQEKNGGFPDGDYSFLDIQRSAGSGFKTNEGGYLAPGVGAFASLLSKSIYGLTQNGKAEYLERNLHSDGLTYFDGPSAPEITEQDSDASVDIDDERLGKRDFSWRFKGLGKTYIWIDTLLISDTNTQEIGKNRLAITLTLRNTPPPVSSVERIGGWENQSGRELNWEAVKPILDNTYTELVTKDFQREINGTDAGTALVNIKTFLERENTTDLRKINKDRMAGFYYSLIYYFTGVVCDYNREHPYSFDDAAAGRAKPGTKLGTYISRRMEADGIYAPLKQIVPLDPGLSELNNNTYLAPDQSIQCVGWVGFLGKLGLPLSPYYIGGIDTGSAKDLVNDEVIRGLRLSDYWVYDELLFARADTLEKVEIGDSFVRYAGNNKNHIGTCVGKKSVDGETVLLITDANRKNDGVIRVFEVDKGNFRVIFGEGAETPPVVIRNKKVQSYLDSWDNPLSFWSGR